MPNQPFQKLEQILVGVVGLPIARVRNNPRTAYPM